MKRTESWLKLKGKIVQCISAVVDVEFAMNAGYDALKMEGSR
jgi:F0F1-type ATP synthase beta subunit